MDITNSHNVLGKTGIYSRFASLSEPLHHAAFLLSTRNRNEFDDLYTATFHIKLFGYEIALNPLFQACSISFARRLLDLTMFS